MKNEPKVVAEDREMALCIPSLLSSFQMLRTFSLVIRVAPFKYEALKKAIKATRPTGLIDEIHFALIRALCAVGYLCGSAEKSPTEKQSTIKQRNKQERRETRRKEQRRAKKDRENEQNSRKFFFVVEKETRGRCRRKRDQR